MSNVAAKSGFDRFRENWGLPIAIIVMLILWFLPTPAGLPLAGKKALVLFSGIFILYLTESVPLVATSIAIVPLAAFMGIAKVGPALAPFASSSVFLMFGAFILAAGMIKTRLAERITYLILNLIGSSTVRITFGVMVANIILVMFIVQFMHVFFAGTTVMATAFLPLIIALGVEAGLSPAVLALPAGMIIGGYPLMMFYCTAPNLMVYGTNKMVMGDFPRVGIPVSILACVVYAVCAATYWRWLGLF